MLRPLQVNLLVQAVRGGQIVKEQQQVIIGHLTNMIFVPAAALAALDNHRFRVRARGHDYNDFLWQRAEKMQPGLQFSTILHLLKAIYEQETIQFAASKRTQGSQHETSAAVCINGHAL